MPWIDKTRLGPQMVAAYFQPYFINVLPNLLFLTAIFFALAALSRKMLPVYVASVLVLIGYFTVSQLSGSALTVSVRAALADPLGSAAIDRITRYWTPFQRNTQLIPLQGILLANRALWLGVGAIFLVVAYVKFAFAYPAEKSKRRGIDRRKRAAVPARIAAHRASHVLRRRIAAPAALAHPDPVHRDHEERFLRGADAGRLPVRHLSPPPASTIRLPTATYPVTYLMLQMAGAGFVIFALAIIIFYSGELVWRERDAQLNQVIDAFPLQRWVLFSSKLFALMLVQVLVVLLILAAGLVVQIAQGYYHFEFGLYFRELFLNRLTALWILCVLAMFVQTIVNNKYLGHFVMVLYIVATSRCRRLDSRTISTASARRRRSPIPT